MYVEFPMTQDGIIERMENGDVPDWWRKRYEAFRSTLLDDDAPFPCYFGVDAESEGNMRYVFCRSDTSSDSLSVLADALYGYCQEYRDIAKRSSCVVFFKSPERELDWEGYKNRFWGVLQYLHENDPEQWPESIPTDPDSPNWEFCFGGEAIFAVGRAPCYERRRSRYTPYGLEITFQPRPVFEGITGDTEQGQKARDIIRDRLKSYDRIDPHPDLGDYGAPGTREWKQYFLPDDNSHTISKCPLDVQPDT